MRDPGVDALRRGGGTRWKPEAIVLLLLSQGIVGFVALTAFPGPAEAGTPRPPISTLAIVIDTNPSGLQLTVDGVPVVAPFSLDCLAGTWHTVDAPPTQSGGPDTRWVFVNWSDGGPPTHDILCDAPRVVTANYGAVYLIVLDTSPAGLTLVVDGVNRVTPVTMWWGSSSVHVVEAPSPIQGPDTRYVFLRWLEDGLVTNVRVITVVAPANYTAMYGAEFRQTLDTSPAGLTVTVDGTTYATPQQRWCPAGSPLAIGTESPQYNGTDRYDFDRWSDGGAQNHTITCAAPATYTAMFLGPFVNPPIVVLDAPVGGEDWTGGTAHGIRWTMSDDMAGPLAYSVDVDLDGSLTYLGALTSGVGPQGPNAFLWNPVDPVNTTVATVRVCVVDAGSLVTCAFSGRFTIDSTKPTLVFSTPPNGAVGVDPNATIVLTFSERMNETATDAAISISPPSTPLSLFWDASGSVLTIDPAAALDPGTLYTVTVSCAAKDVSDPGNALATCPRVLGFTTAVFHAPPLPTISRPLGGERWTGGSSQAIRFTVRDIDSPQVHVYVNISTDGGVTFLTNLYDDVAVTTNTLQSIPMTIPNTNTLNAMIRVEAVDPTFTTGRATSASFQIDAIAPTVQTVDPVGGDINVPTGKRLAITFSEPMNGTATYAAFSISPDPGGWVATWTAADTLELSHSDLAGCTRYTAAISTAATDASDPGNALAAPYAWSFTTVCAPVVTLEAPAPGADWTGGVAHDVTFMVTDADSAAATVWVNLSTDGGATFPTNLYTGSVPTGSAQTRSVPIPLADTAAAVVRVAAQDATRLEGFGASAAFAIDSTPPTVAATVPADGARNQSVTTDVVLTFSEAMDRASVEGAITILPAAIAPSFSWDGSGRVLTIRFGAPLAAYMGYAVTVGCAARDASEPGNVLEGCPGRPFRTAFTTEILDPPPIASALPVAGARVGETVTFDGRGSSGNITSWTWTAATSAGEVVASLQGSVATHAFVAPGTYTVTLRVADAYGRSDEYSFRVVVTAGGGPGEGPLAGNAVVLIVVTAGALAAILFAASEPGRVALVTATAGALYGRKPKDERDSEFRGAVLYYVRVHPGDAYADIRRNLGLNDGVVTYHLARLERDGLIKSTIRGARKRYYPAKMRMPVENGGELHEIQQRILRVVAASPGMPVAVLAEQLGVSYQLALYHVRKLHQGHRVELGRSGLRLCAYPGQPKG